MKMLKIISLSIFLVLSGASSAHAMGDREQAALLGAGAAVLLGGIINAAHQPIMHRLQRLCIESRIMFHPV